MAIPATFDITVTEFEPYDLRLRLEWSDTESRLTLRELTFRAQPDGGERVRMSHIIRIAISELIEKILVGEVLGGPGWPGVIADHAAHDPVAVDALVYRLSLALGGQAPSASVAIARGLSPASGPKRVAAARHAGLIPHTDPGKPSAATPIDVLASTAERLSSTLGAPPARTRRATPKG
jgi:hypothetical protein